MTAVAVHNEQFRLVEDDGHAADKLDRVDAEYLRRTVPADPVMDDETIAIVDLFSGCGGLTLGALEGARRSERGARLHLAADHDPLPLEVLAHTLADDDARYETVDLEAVSFATGPVTSAERNLFDAPERSLLLAGPPCQGHSALNNHTRHDDSRNSLYLAVSRVAEILRPRAIVVENVRGVGRDRRDALTTCTGELRSLGYHVDDRALDLHLLGVPQRRIRHVLVATSGAPFAWTLEPAPGRDLRWAIGDLVDAEQGTVLDSSSKASRDNAQRLDWLFENGAYDLPNNLRPVCHQSDHSYRAMYGRLRWDEPAQTVTSGYGSMGQGRYVHPEKRRTLTPHEAARLQFLPDFVRLDLVERRGALATMIANVAPPRLTIVIVQALIAQGLL